ncbi:MAG: glycerol-3-phosphate 1-O-acyltransferase PlsY [Pseudomonadota bacterium]
MLDLLHYTDSNTIMLSASILIIIAYLMGSIASAILVCQLLGLSDPRSGGSGNPGATNVMRLHGKKAAVLTLLGDVVKGFLPVMLALYLNQPDLIIALCGLAAFTGHVFPVFFKFKGGKGVATLIGVLFATHWQLGLGFVFTWLIIAGIFRYSSLAALVAAALSPIYAWFALEALPYLFCHGIMVAMLFWRHQSNIQNLMAGNEGKIGAGKTKDPT